MKKFTLLFMLVCSSLIAYSQTISGNVNSEAEGGLIGATVQLKGTSTGTVTDFDGNYSLDLDALDGVLIFSYIGYQSQEIAINGQSVLNVTLSQGQELDEVVVVGSRAPARTNTESPVPVDVLDLSKLTQNAPQLSVNQILNYAAPSFSSNAQTIADGTDHLDPAQLRGLGTDQVLVLVNGKRRHQSSLVNVNGSVGRGSVATDLNTIPAAAIKRIEVLRDGAAAQYGSDAIAGVINIVLKDQVGKLEMGFTGGANFTEGANRFQGGSDGENFQLDANYGLGIGKNGGFINFTGSFATREWTSRARERTGTIYNVNNVGERLMGGYDAATDYINQNGLAGYADYILQNATSDVVNAYNNASVSDDAIAGLMNSFGLSAADAEAAFRLRADATDSELIQRGRERLDFAMRVGQSRSRSGQFFANMEIPLNENTDIYSAAGLSYRDGESAGFYRRPDQSRAFTGLYPDGFLPEIHSDIQDRSVIAGIRSELDNGWFVDFSNTFGQNTFDYTIENSHNATLQGASELSYEAGGFSFSQNTTNLDVSRYYEDIAAGFNLAWGAEYRVENYELNAGSEGSYGLYDVNGVLIQDDTGPVGADDGRVYDNLWRRRPAGVQVFPGYRPQNEVDQSRNSLAGYLDVELNTSERFLISAAARYENYSDFGSTLNGKLAARFKVTENFNLRGAASTGFRAPSLHQIYFNSVSTLFVGGQGFEVLTARNDSKIARDIGIEQLQEETSRNFSLGFTAKVPSLNMKFTVDGFFVAVDDRITLTDQIRRTDFADRPDIQRLFTQAEAERVQFFGNFVNTETQGIDIVIDHKANLADGLVLRNSLAATFSENEVVGTNIPNNLAGDNVASRVVSIGSKSFIEDAFPRSKINLNHSLTFGKWNFYLRNVYFGEVFDADVFTSTNSAFTTEAQSEARRDEATFGGKIITDLTVGYSPSENVRFTLGANNLFDVYPDEQPVGTQGGGDFIYSRRVSQFGTTGRQLFARLNVNF